MGMQLRLFSATGAGPTPLAAFDRALQQGNVHDTNLIVLSSVVPVGATVVRELPQPGEFRVGDRLYCVMAEERTVEPGSEAWAGLAWATDINGGGGLFVEAHGASEHFVRWELEMTINALLKDRPYMETGPVDMEVIGIACESDPVCAMVMCVYEPGAWGDGRSSVAVDTGG